MHGRLRFLALAAVGLAVATVAALLGTWAAQPPVTGQPIAAPVTEETTPPVETTTPAETYSTETPPTSFANPSSSSSTNTRPAGAPVTIAKRKTIATAPSCPTLITGTEIARLTGTTAAPEPNDPGFCGFDLASGGSPAGVATIVLVPTTDAPGAEPTTFEGNTAYRTTTVTTTCDLRVALTDDPSAPFRALWVTLVLTKATESTCPTVEKLAKIVFDKLPDG
jgi:hypothetical protein